LLELVVRWMSERSMRIAFEAEVEHALTAGLAIIAETVYPLVAMLVSY
jgi:hypothetical protein